MKLIDKIHVELNSIIINNKIIISLGIMYIDNIKLFLLCIKPWYFIIVHRIIWGTLLRRFY